MDTDRLIKRGCDSTSGAWLKECCEMERDYDERPQEIPDASAALTGWPYSVDMVNSPPHYNHGEIECIDAIKAALTPEEYRGYLKGTVFKYLWRERLKGGKESVAKGGWFYDKLQESYK